MHDDIVGVFGPDPNLDDREGAEGRYDDIEISLTEDRIVLDEDDTTLE